MIILMSLSEENLHSVKSLKDEVQIYPEINLRQMSGDTVVLYDLNSDDSFTNVSPKGLTNELMRAGLPTNVSKIKLIVSNLNSQTQLTIFAQKMTDYFAENYQRTITCFIPTNINYAATVVVPPGLGMKEWFVYASSQPIENKKNLNVASLVRYYPHHLLWRGEDIYAWLEQSKQRQFKSYLS